MNLHGWTCLAEAKRAKQLLIGIITKYNSLERERERERERETERERERGRERERESRFGLCKA